MRFAKDDGVSAGQQQEEEDSRRREEEQDAFLEGRTEGLPSREEVWTWYVEGIEKSVRESGNQNGDGISSGFEEGEKEFADGFMLFRVCSPNPSPFPFSLPCPFPLHSHSTHEKQNHSIGKLN